MPRQKPRMSYTLDEVFGALPVSQDEVEIERTNGTPLDPNWTGPMKKFSLGLSNARDTIASNMIAKKTASTSLSLSDFLDFINTTHMRLFDFIIHLIDKILPLRDAAQK